jgi:predicted nucleotidyltransferase
MKTFTEKRFQPLHELGSEKKNSLIGKIKDYLLQNKDIVFACVHGSFIKSDKFRDIDIAVFTSDKKDFYFESGLSYELSSFTGFDTEVRIINGAPVAFQMAALKDGLLLFSRDEDIRTDFIEDVGKRYRVYAHFRNIFMGCEGVGHQ